MKRLNTFKKKLSVKSEFSSTDTSKELSTEVRKRPASLNLPRSPIHSTIRQYFSDSESPTEETNAPMISPDTTDTQQRISSILVSTIAETSTETSTVERDFIQALQISLGVQPKNPPQRHPKKNLRTYEEIINQITADISKATLPPCSI